MRELLYPEEIWPQRQGAVCHRMTRGSKGMKHVPGWLQRAERFLQKAGQLGARAAADAYCGELPHTGEQVCQFRSAAPIRIRSSGFNQQRVTVGIQEHRSGNL